MPDWQKYRSLFPHTTDMVFMNHAAVSPYHQRLITAFQELIQDRAVDNIIYWPTAWEKRQQLKALIGSLINASADYIAIIPNTGTGFHHLALGLEWKAGDRIILNNFEFPANVHPFLNLQRFGVEIDFVPHREGRILVEDLAAAITPRTRLLSISFVEFLNGFRPDLKTISQLCHQHGIIFSVDGIQGIGAVPFDVRDLDVDFLSCGCQKWLMSSMGVAFMYIAPHLFERLYPALSGWLSVKNSWNFFDYKLDFLEDAGRFEGSSMNVPGIIGAIASLEMLLEIGIEPIWAKIRTTTDYLIQALKMNGYRLFTIEDEAQRSGIVTFYHEQGEELVKSLERQKIIVSFRSGMVRVSPHFYNSGDDIDHFMRAVSAFDNRAAKSRNE